MELFFLEGVDFTGVDSVKDHVKSKKNTIIKKLKQSGSSGALSSRQTTLDSIRGRG